MYSTKMSVFTILFFLTSLNIVIAKDTQDMMLDEKRFSAALTEDGQTSKTANFGDIQLKGKDWITNMKRVSLKISQSGDQDNFQYYFEFSKNSYVQKAKEVKRDVTYKFTFYDVNNSILTTMYTFWNRTCSINKDTYDIKAISDKSSTSNIQDFINKAYKVKMGITFHTRVGWC